MVSLFITYKELELEDDAQLESSPSNAFVIHSLVVYDDVDQRLLSSSVRRSRRSLCLSLYSVDTTHEYEIAPVASLHPKLTERLRFYALHSGDELHYVPMPVSNPGVASRIMSRTLKSSTIAHYSS